LIRWQEFRTARGFEEFYQAISSPPAIPPVTGFDHDVFRFRIVRAQADQIAAEFFDDHIRTRTVRNGG
jgi:hypothetical protein